MQQTGLARAALANADELQQVVCVADRCDSVTSALSDKCLSATRTVSDFCKLCFVCEARHRCEC